MPYYRREPVGVVGWTILLSIASLITGLLIYWKPWWALGIGVFGVVASVVSWHEGRHVVASLRCMASERTDRSICTFARSFNCRQTDTWIIRAVWDTLQTDCIPANLQPFPIRRTDRLREDLHLDYMEIDDLAVVVAERAGRTWTNAEANAFFDRVLTVGDLVHIFSLQPPATHSI